MLQIVLGVTGGIAAYKATSIIRLFDEAGHSVKVIPTENALRFIGATTLEALSHNAVDADLYSDVADVKHVNLGQQANLIVIAPATANFIAKLAAGIADDLLGNTILASTAPILIAPAMHTEMWLNQATVANIETLRNRGIHVLEPAEGRLTGEDTGVGRLPDPEVIVASALALVTTRDLQGKHIIVTAGGTREAIDPVRYIGNHSSGKQGVALARAASARGAQVTLIGANIPRLEIPNVRFVAVETATELEAQVYKELDSADALIQAAAVSDFRVASPATKKLKRSVLGDAISIDLVANPDILAGAVSRIRAEGLNCTSVGFAAETSDSTEQLREVASAKLMSKGCDIIVANDVSEGKVFGEDDNHALIQTKSGFQSEVTGNKLKVANAILDILFQ
ncbi:MAG: bifunctional phosphopantothenoylcysteine decarboxylase/phosphopantothenate--cysteine ligase CoaBC [Micrococcales bacterium]